ncbi:helix-turn-helix domain-containing protein [Natranaerofaba carboxydovora]|uniref:helix-turn-helix domain-containing protein n=1 Tax=Natranaerofaba carboxydovora TaxID=2742683 RepID=UPI001F13EA50|nr:XRE family transcriptional regulator [Natranaerofaba carboxydovora]UMZ74823.1 HTH-type transcriptional regulator PuuR [Natranaerofaba carboxydovora]
MEKYIGMKIKEQRKIRNLTIASLSSKTGLSESLISRVEKGNVVPSISTLRKIAQGLGVSITEFFKEERDLNEDKLVVRKYDRKKLLIPGSKTKYEILSPDICNKIELLQVEFEPHSEEKKLIHLGDDEEECALLVRGELEFNFGSEKIKLYQGDSIYIKREYLESVKNPLDEKSIIILMIVHNK